MRTEGTLKIRGSPSLTDEGAGTEVTAWFGGPQLVNTRAGSKALVDIS